MVFGALESDPAVPGLDGSAGHHRTQTMHQSLGGGGSGVCTECACLWTVGWDHCRTIMRWTCCNQYHCNPSMIYINIEFTEIMAKCKHPVNSYTLIEQGNSFGANSRREHTDQHTPENVPPRLGPSRSSVLLLHLTWTLTSLTFALCSQTTNHNGRNTRQQTHTNCSNPTDIHFHC